MISRAVFALLLFSALAAIGVPATQLHAESANTDFKRGQAAEARADYDTAFDLYQKAYNRDPSDTRFQIALARIRTTASSAHVTKGRKLFQAGDVQGALAEFLHAAEIDPGNEAAQQEIARIRQKQGTNQPAPEAGLPEPSSEAEALGTVELRPSSSRFQTSRFRCT